MASYLSILGAGGHAKVVAYTARAQFPDIRLEFFARDKPAALEPYSGSINAFIEQAKGKTFFVAIGDCATRLKIAQRARESGAESICLVHPNAVVAPDVKIGTGSLVAAGTVIHPNAQIGSDCIINTGSIVEHDCLVESGVHLGPGAILAGGAVVRRSTWIGMGARVLEGREIVENVVLGAGAVATRSIREAGVYMGIPARPKLDSNNRLQKGGERTI